jgi:deoxyribodipyrimidine photo-lyase
MQVFWHRGDLRASDNRGLAAAARAVESDADAAVVPVFVFDEQVLAHAGPSRVAFMLDALASLRDWYRDRGSDLVVRHGDPAEVIPAVAREYGAERVLWNHDYSGLAAERDGAVRAALEAAGVRYDAFHDAVLHEPGVIRTNAGDPYAVYSYYWKKWRDREKPSPVPAPIGQSLAAVSASEALPSLDDLGFERPDVSLPEAGTAVAHQRLRAFLADDVYRYEEARERPAADATSRLSPDLAFGTIGIRAVHDAVTDARADAPDEAARESVETFRSQLAWREFYTQVLHFNPGVVTENYRDYPTPIEWRNDPGELAAWKAGETGFPLVDAGMRQLRDEAFVHNRVRMVVASFLTKDLLWDWRAGYAHFREHLVDHDTANDTGGWQWAASTGTDAQPYFRVFNPQTQGERHDPDAEYITRYVPELRDVPASSIHDWPSLDPAEREDVAPNYPAPIVDHAERREAAIAAFEAARGD